MGRLNVLCVAVLGLGVLVTAETIRHGFHGHDNHLVCWVLPNASIPMLRAMDLTCPLRPYETIDEVLINGSFVGVESRADLAFLATKPQTTVTAKSGDSRRQLQIPTIAASAFDRAIRILVAIVINGVLVAFAMWMVQRLGHPADTPVGLLVATGAFHVTTTLARPTSLALDVGWVVTQGLAAAAISHLSLAMPRSRRVPERLPGVVIFFYAMAFAFAIVEVAMILRGSRLWELPDRLLGSWILFGAVALSVSSYLALVESQSREEQRIARLLLLGSAAFVASVALVSAGAGSALPANPRRTLVALTTVLIVGLAYLASYHSPSDMPRLLRWMASYVVYTSGVASVIYIVVMLGENSATWPWPKLDPAFFLLTVFVGLIVTDQIRRGSWGLAEIWVSPWAPRLERVQRSHALGASTLEDADGVLGHFNNAIEEALGSVRVCGFLSAGSGSWRLSAAIGCKFDPGLAKDAIEVLGDRVTDKGLPTHAILLSDIMGQDDPCVARLRASGVVAMCGLRGRHTYRGVVLIGKHPRFRTFSTDHIRFLEQLALHSSLALQKADLEHENLTTMRLAAYGHAAAGLAHDMGRPLGEISVESKLVAGSDSKDAYASSLETINALASECLGLLEQFVREGRFSIRTNTHHVQLGVVLRSAVDRLLRLHPERKIVVRISPDEPFVNDPANLQRVVENLVENSLQWSRSEEPIEVVGNIVGRWAVIRVVDSGMGMRSEVSRRAFEPFFSMSQGGGLGLTICKDIVSALDGSISIDSSYRCGTAVTVKIPAKAGH